MEVHNLTAACFSQCCEGPTAARRAEHSASASDSEATQLATRGCEALLLCRRMGRHGCLAVLRRRRGRLHPQRQLPAWREASISAGPATRYSLNTQHGPHQGIKKGGRLSCSSKWPGSRSPAQTSKSRPEAAQGSRLNSYKKGMLTHSLGSKSKASATVATSLGLSSPKPIRSCKLIWQDKSTLSRRKTPHAGQCFRHNCRCR